MCPSAETCLPVDSCFSELALCNLVQRFGLEQSGHHQYLLNVTGYRLDIAEESLTITPQMW
jgi:hypothetical protein